MHTSTPIEARSSFTDPFGRRFTFQQPLGEGGFGCVWLATMHSPGGLSQRVAVKLLHEDLDLGSQAVQRLRDEARLLSALHHPVILAAHDLVEIGSRMALVTEYIEGEDLAACLASRDADRIPMGSVLQIIESVASALSAAYEQLSVVHRDIKPQNIRIGRHGNVKLLDFGIARSGRAPRDARTQTQMMVGSLGYLAPERFESEYSPEPASDVFSLGCVLYEALTDGALFGTLSMTEQLRLSVIKERWEPFLSDRLRQTAPLPAPLRALVGEMLSHDAAARPTAGEVAARCEILLEDLEDPVPLRRWCKERRWPEPLRAEVPPPGADPRATIWRERSSPARTVEPREPISADSLERPTPSRPAPEEAPAGSIQTLPSLLIAGGAVLVTLFAVGGSLVFVLSALVTLLLSGRGEEQVAERHEIGASPAPEAPHPPAPEEPEIEPPATVHPENKGDTNASRATSKIDSEEITHAAPDERKRLELTLPTPAGGVEGTSCGGEIDADKVLTLSCVEPYLGEVLVALQPHLSTPASVAITFAGAPEPSATALVDELEGWPSMPFGTPLARTMRVREVEDGVTHVDPGSLLTGYLGLRIAWADVHFVEGRANAVSLTVPSDAATKLQLRWGPPTRVDGEQLEWSGKRVSVQLNKRRLVVRLR